jgi:hypothetical protein
VPFRTLGRIRASVVTKGTNILQLCFPTCQIPQKTDCQGGQGSPRAVAPSKEEEDEEEVVELIQIINYLIKPSLHMVMPYMDFSTYSINNPTYFVEISYGRLP